MTQPLSGIKVLDFSEHGFVPSAAAALADWGADVIKVERPEGDPMRQIISQGLVADADGYDYLFQLVNRNKRGVSIDVLAPEGREVFERLVRWADVYITNQLPRVRRKAPHRTRGPVRPQSPPRLSLAATGRDSEAKGPSRAALTPSPSGRGAGWPTCSPIRARMC